VDLEQQIAAKRRELQELYNKKTTPHKDLAEKERDLWLLVKKGCVIKGERPPRYGIYFNELGSKLAADAEQRHALLNADCFELLSMVDNGALSMSEASVRLRAARRTPRSSASLAATATSLAKSSSPPSSFAEEEEKALAGRQLFDAIKKIVAQYVAAKMVKADPSERTVVLNEFMNDTRVALDDLFKKLDRYRRDQKKDEKLSFSAIVKACECLGIPEPAIGESVDMEKARSIYKRLSSQLHPDRRRENESPNVVAQYTAVQEAWETLQEYTRQLKP
jgi:hypothetical protein